MALSSRYYVRYKCQDKLYTPVVFLIIFFAALHFVIFIGQYFSFSIFFYFKYVMVLTSVHYFYMWFFTFFWYVRERLTVDERLSLFGHLPIYCPSFEDYKEQTTIKNEKCGPQEKYWEMKQQEYTYTLHCCFMGWVTLIEIIFRFSCCEINIMQLISVKVLSLSHFFISLTKGDNFRFLISVTLYYYLWI